MLPLLLAAASAAAAMPALVLLLVLLAPLLLAATVGAILVRALARPGRLFPSWPPPPSTHPPRPLPPDAAAGTGALNAALAGLWPALAASLHSSATAALAASLPPLPPPLAWALARTRLALVGTPPMLDRLAISCPAAEAGGGGALAADAALSWAGGVEVGLGLTRAGGPPFLSVGAAVEGVTAAVRAEVLSFSPGPPTPADTVRLSLARPPDLAVSTWVGSPLAAGFLPFLDAVVEGAVREALVGPLLAPGGAELTWPPGGESVGAARPWRGRGLVVVDLEGGAGLPPRLLRRGARVIALVSVPGGRAVGGGGGGGSGGGTAAITGRVGRAGTLTFAGAPPAVFTMAPDAAALRVRVALYGMTGGRTPLALGAGEVEVGAAGAGEEEAAATIPLAKAGPAPLTPRTAAATAGVPAAPRPRLTARLTVGRPGEEEAAARSPPPPSSSPGTDWLGGGVLRVGLGSPPPSPPPTGGGPPRPALARLVEVAAAGRTAWLGEGEASGPRPAVDLALPASAVAAPGAALSVAAHDWAWAAAADAPLSFTRPGPGRTAPASLCLPLVRLEGAPGGHTAGLFRLAGAPPGVPAAVALEARWVAFRGGG